ncbi:hypothetical protein OROGR_006275 [Orobanche gracilis]
MVSSTSSNVSRSPIADAESSAAAATATADAENQAVWKRPNMRGSKCSINEYVRLGIVKMIIVELGIVGEDTIREFRESRVLDTLSGRSGGLSLMLHCMPCSRTRFEYALVIEMRFRDSDFDVYGDDVPIEGSVYDRYPMLSGGGQMLDRIRDRFASGYFRQQTRDALKVDKVGPDSMGELSMGGYSYQILVTYLREVPTEIPAGLDPSYHFYDLGWRGYTFVRLQMWDHSRSIFHPATSLYAMEVEEVGTVAFTTFFNDEIDWFEVLSPTPEEEQEPYMLSICDNASERVQYTHMMPLFKKGVLGRGRGGLVMVILLSESVLFGSGHLPHEFVHTDSQRRSSPIRRPHQTASSSARGTKETAPITDFDTLFTRLRQYIDSTAQQIYRYIDNTAQETRRHMKELLGHSLPLATPHWNLRGLDDFMSGFSHDGSVPTEPLVAQTESIPTVDLDRASSPTEHTEGVPSPSGAVVPVECTLSLDHQLSVPTVTLSVILLHIRFAPGEMAMEHLGVRLDETESTAGGIQSEIAKLRESLQASIDSTHAQNDRIDTMMKRFEEMMQSGSVLLDLAYLTHLLPTEISTAISIETSATVELEIRRSLYKVPNSDLISSQFESTVYDFLSEYKYPNRVSERILSLSGKFNKSTSSVTDEHEIQRKNDKLISSGNFEESRSCSNGMIHEQLLEIKQSKSIDEYRNRLISLAASLAGDSEEIKLSEFVSGFETVFRVELRLRSPTCLEEAIQFVVKIEERNRDLMRLRFGGDWAYQKAQSVAQVVVGESSTYNPSSVDVKTMTEQILKNNEGKPAGVEDSFKFGVPINFGSLYNSVTIDSSQRKYKKLKSLNPLQNCRLTSSQFKSDAFNFVLELTNPKLQEEDDKVFDSSRGNSLNTGGASRFRSAIAVINKLLIFSGVEEFAGRMRKIMHMVDAAVLQYQNQKLVQQLDTQKQELHDLESKIKELKEKQTLYDEVLIKVNQHWNQLVDDIILLGVQAGAGQSALRSLDRIESSRTKDIFPFRLLETYDIQSRQNEGSVDYVKEALVSRQDYTRELMKVLEGAIDSRRAKIEDIAQILVGKTSVEDALIQVCKLDDWNTKETSRLNEVVDVLHDKHKHYADGIQTCINNHSVEQLEIKHLAGELEESMAKLEDSRRKLVNLRMQKDGVSGMRVPIPVHVIVPTVNGSVSPEKRLQINQSV